MNRTQANEIRASMGLQPLPQVDTAAQKRRQDTNKAARAQANRDLKSKRTGRGK
jgi:hypothetical protein